jgi:hypothetical protein
LEGRRKWRANTGEGKDLDEKDREHHQHACYIFQPQKWIVEETL